MVVWAFCDLFKKSFSSQIKYIDFSIFYFKIFGICFSHLSFNPPGVDFCVGYEVDLSVSAWVSICPSCGY